MNHKVPHMKVTLRRNRGVVRVFGYTKTVRSSVWKMRLARGVPASAMMFVKLRFSIQTIKKRMRATCSQCTGEIPCGRFAVVTRGSTIVTYCHLRCLGPKSALRSALLRAARKDPLIKQAIILGD